MGLDKLVYIPSVGTDALYRPEEKAIHERLLKLYHARMKQDANYFDKPDKKTKKRRKAKSWEKQPWKKACYNRLIKKEKDKLTALLDENLKSTEPRALDSSLICAKTTVSLFESTLTRALGIKTWDFSRDLIILNVFFFQVFESAVKYGFMLDGEKYVFLTASAGQIRTKKAVFVKESAYKAIEKRMMCGLTVEHINELGGMNPNKYSAYLALNGSATEAWEDFDIDKSIVVDDWETDVGGEVDYIDDVTYEIKRQYANTTIPHMDGCGIMLDGPTRMCRLPWVKGLLVQFPYDEFIKEKCNGQGIVTDIYGQEHDVLAEGIKYIFTKSQFKLWKFYNSWDEYKTYFKQYGCEACYCNIEEKYIRRSRINYQMLQTLSDMTDGEIARLVKETNHEIEEIGHDFQTTMKLLGAVPENSNTGYFQQALMIYPELFRDYYCRDIIKQTKLSMVKHAKGGRLRVNGKYLFLSPDLYAFCEWLFLGEMNPKGLLEDGEVYTTIFVDGRDLACLRSPHLYREWAIRKNTKNPETERWFGETKCVYTSCHDLISRYLMFDNDGDKSLVVDSSLLTSIAKRNMQDIVPLAYNLRKAKGGLISNDSLYDGMAHAYTGGNIGPISNNITKVWNCGSKIGEEQMNVVKWLTFYNNAVIDYAKTLWKPEPPANIAKIINSYTKANVPDFFVYAKDKAKHQVEPPNNSTMNRISAAIASPRIRFSKTIGKFDYRMLMNLDADFSVSPESDVVKRYDYWNTHLFLFDTQDGDGIKQEEMYAYRKIRENIIEETGKDLDYITNTLVAVLYTTRNTSQKKTLWACFGDVIVENLKKNTVGLGNICPVCGRRFQPKRIDQVYCSNECYEGGHRRK